MELIEHVQPGQVFSSLLLGCHLYLSVVGYVLYECVFELYFVFHQNLGIGILVAPLIGFLESVAIAKAFGELWFLAHNVRPTYEGGRGAVVAEEGQGEGGEEL